MRLTAILLLSACLGAAAAGNSQTVTINVKDASLEKVFKEIRRQTGYNFLFSSKDLKDAGNVTVQIKNASIEQVLAVCFENKPFEYKIVDQNTIIVKQKTKSPSPALQSGGNSHSPPPVDIRGRIVNENGEPVIASVMVKGTNIGTTTNANGEFQLTGIDEDAVLVISGVSIEPMEIAVAKNPGLKSGGGLTIAAKTEITTLNEVVINKGYYTEKQRLSTGNTFSVKAKDIEKQPVNNPLLALVGRVPGVTIEQQTGFANSGVVVRIQGRNSINSGLDPLYVIDGVPYLSQSLPTVGIAQGMLGNSGGNYLNGGGNPLSFINPSDIESIDILKDADATAIYGSRGANGVVLITTKRGKVGQTRVSANFRSGWGRVAKKLDLLNTDQYLEMRKEAYVNDGRLVPNQSSSPSNSNYDLTVWDQNRYTNWQKELIGGTANYTDAQVSIGGGTVNTQFLLSSGYHKETTVFPGDFSDKKGSFQFNINHSTNDKRFKLGASSIYVVDNNQIPGRDLTADAMKLAPNAPALYNSDGTINWEQINVGGNKISTWTNPLSYMANRYKNKVTNLIANFQISYEFLPGLDISSRFGYTNLQSDETSIIPLQSTRPEMQPFTHRTAEYGNGNNNSWIIEPHFTYETNVLNGKLASLVGGSFQQNTTTSQRDFGWGYSSDLLLNSPSAAPNIMSYSTYYSLYKYNAIFGRINYNFHDKYLVNATIRRDGSSRFGSENLFSNFWSLAGSWIFTNEKWFSEKTGFLNFGKLRLSYGTSGNDQIGDYGFMSLYNPVYADVAFQGISALEPNGLTNPYLQWEETNKFQVGLDLGAFNNSINLAINYYHNRSSNLLSSSRLSIITGFNEIKENFKGVVQNEGWEFSINTINAKSKNFNWNTNLNFTIPVQNGKLVSFPDIEKTSHANTYEVGRSLYDVKVYQFSGVDQITGRYQFTDEKGQLLPFPLTAKDRVAFANTTQKFYGGIQNSISYRNFELDFTFQIVSRKAFLYYGEEPGWFSGRGNKGNQTALVLSRWQKPGDFKPIQKVTATYPDFNSFRALSYYGSSTGSLTDAFYTRLTNLSLSWQLLDRWKKEIHLQEAKLFLQGQNLFTITKYKGLDPSTGSSISLPPLQIFTLGFNMSF